MSAQAATIGEYWQLVDRFAVGGAAEVYRARDVRTGQMVAIKRLRPDMPFDPEVSGGFLREIQLALLSNHPNLIRGMANGSHDGLDYVVLEFVEGKDLDQLLQEALKQRLELPQSFWLFIVREMLNGLHFAHGMQDGGGNVLGLVHRDVNPRNVMIDFFGHVKLADFGAAVASFQEPTPEEVVGSVGYMAPEQASLQFIDRRSDVFAVGCLLYELVVGERAFDMQGKKDAAVLKLHQRGEIRPIPPHVDEGVRLCIEIATSFDPEERYRDAASMRDALDNIMAQRADELRHLVAKGMRQLFREEFMAVAARN